MCFEVAIGVLSYTRVRSLASVLMVEQAVDTIASAMLALSTTGDKEGVLRDWIRGGEYRGGETIEDLVAEWDSNGVLNLQKQVLQNYHSLYYAAHICADALDDVLGNDDNPLSRATMIENIKHYLETE